jgi:hypothetical protein
VGTKANKNANPMLVPTDNDDLKSAEKFFSMAQVGVFGIIDAIGYIWDVLTNFISVPIIIAFKIILNALLLFLPHWAHKIISWTPIIGRLVY